MTADPVTTLAWLFLAHFVADFILQTNRMAADKGADGPRALMGIGRHTAAVAVCLAPVIAAFGLPGIVFVVLISLSHGLIDRAKILATRRAYGAAIPAGEDGDPASPGTPATPGGSSALGATWTPVPGALFALDQLAHLGLIVLLWAVLLADVPLTAGWERTVGMVTARWNPVVFGEAMLWIAVVGSLLIVNVRGASFFVATLVTPGPAGGDGPEPTPDRIGETIGVLERLLVVVFVLGGAGIAVGLVIAAKTIARFRQLDDRAFAEYYLLGTLASVSVAVLSGLVAAAALGL
jgi:hypothetical protein